MIVGNGHNISLWKDKWQRDCSLSSSYHHLHQLCSTPDISLFTVVVFGGEALHFNRQLIGVLCIEFNELCAFISQVQPSLDNDQLAWRWHSSGSFLLTQPMSGYCSGAYSLTMMDSGGTSLSP
jgi:hypothetical protein